MVKKKKNQTIQENQEMQFQSRDQEDPLEQERASHSRVLARRIPWQEEPGGLQPTGLQSAEQSAQTRLSTPVLPRRVLGAEF